MCFFLPIGGFFTTFRLRDSSDMPGALSSLSKETAEFPLHVEESDSILIVWLVL